MSIADDVTWHQIHLERYKQGVQNKMVRRLNESRQTVLKKLNKLRRKIESGESKAFWTMRRLEVQLQNINELLKNDYAKLNTILEKSNNELTHNEIDWNHKNLSNYVGAGTTVHAPAPAAVYASVVERPFEGWLSDDGKLRYVHNSPLRNVPKRHMKEMERIIKDAFVTGQTTQDAAKQMEVANNMIARTKKSYDIARRNIAAETRTSLQTYANRAREETYLANADLFPWVEYFATLDSRTTEICASLDGRVYRVDNFSRPVIPQHWNCRSTYIPKKTRDEDVGIERPTVDPGPDYEKGDNKTKTGKVRKPRKGNSKLTRNTKPGNTKFNDWLKEQDKKNPDFVRDYFKSDKRYEQWKAGKLGKIKYTSVDGRTYDIKSIGFAGAKGVGPVLRQSLGSELAQNLAVYKSGYVKKVLNVDGKQIGAIFKATDPGGFDFYKVRMKGKFIEGQRFDTIDDAESFIKVQAGKAPKRVTKKKVVKPKKKVVAKKKVAKKKAVKPGQKLVKKVEDENGKRFGGIYQVTAEDGTVYFRARRKGKWFDETFKSVDDAESAIRGTSAGVVEVKAGYKIPSHIKDEERKLWAEIPDEVHEEIDRMVNLNRDRLAIAEARQTAKIAKDNLSDVKLPPGAISDVASDLDDQYMSALKAQQAYERQAISKLWKALTRGTPKSITAKIDSQLNKINFNLKSNVARLSRARMHSFGKLFNGYIPEKLNRIIKDSPRAYMNFWDGRINVGGNSKRVIYHEMAHFIDYEFEDINKAVVEFLRRRRTSPKTKRLSEITGGKYGPDEIAYEDKWIKAYVGKKYKSEYVWGRNVQATEVTSMGIERFSEDWSMKNFMYEDIEHFKLMLGIIYRIRRLQGS